MPTTDASNSSMAGLALSVAAVTLFGLLMLCLMFALRSGPFGTLNDICNALGALLSVALAAAVYAQHQARSPQLAPIALAAVIAGAALAVVGSWLVMSGRTGFFLAGMYTMAGYALTGLWLLALNQAGLWPRDLVVFGLIAGGVMALGFAAVPSTFLRIDSFQDAAWHTWVGQAGFIGWALLYPIWCIRLWQVLRSG